MIGLQHHGGPHRPPASSCDDSYDCLSIQTACRTWLERVADERGTRAEAAAAALWYLRGRQWWLAAQPEEQRAQLVLVCLLARVDDPAGTLDWPLLLLPFLTISRQPTPAFIETPIKPHHPPYSLIPLPILALRSPLDLLPPPPSPTHLRRSQPANHPYYVACPRFVLAHLACPP